MNDAGHPPSPDPATAGPHILLDDRQDLPVDSDDLRALALACLRGEGVQRGELSISLVADDEIAELHERFMGEPGPTDVLSFGFDDEDDRAPGGAPLLGDVVISPATAVRNAAEHGNDPTGEVRLLLAHGVLHLLGYTHDEEIDRASMWERQEGYSGVRTP
ncbi:MAG: rRNA maturation RNase YbeY [Actinomycetota bacterium]